MDHNLAGFVHRGLGGLPSSERCTWGEGQNCQVYLESPCADLDLFTLRYNPYTSVPPSCPESGELNIQCEESTNPGPGFDERSTIFMNKIK